MPTLQHDFKFFTSALKAYEVTKDDGSKDLFLQGIASSTAVDRQGDRMTLQAQAEMEQSAVGITLFLNHSYEVPEDVLGTCESAVLQRAVDGTDNFDLVIRVKICQENDRAIKVWRSVSSGVTLGFSVGGQVLDAKKNGDVVEILSINLLEISACGIPANPRANITEVIAKSLRKAQKQQNAGDLHTSIIDMEIQNQATDNAETIDETVVVEAEDTQKALAEAEEAVDAAAPEIIEDAITKDVQPDIIKEGREISEANAQKLYEAKMCIKSAMEHVCSAGAAHLNNAHEIIKSLLPAGFEGDPEDPEPTTEDPGAQQDVIPDDDDTDDNESRKSLEISVDTSEIKELVDSAVADVAKQLSDKDAEISALLQTIEELKATPVGRFTKATGSPSSSTVDPEARRIESDTDIHNQLTRALRGL